MSLNKEYERKIDVFLEYLPKRVYNKTAEVEFEGFFTYDRMSLDEALAHKKEFLPQGLEWGKKWEYGWFFTTVTIPEKCKGQRVVFKTDLSEALAFVNNKVYGALDRTHKEVTLTRCAKGGEVFEIALEVYAGHDGENPAMLRACNAIFMMPDEDNSEFPENVTQQVVKNGEFGIFYDEIFSFYMDMYILKDLLLILDDKSLRAALVCKALKKACDAVDIEAPFDEFFEMVKAGRKELKPALEAKNGSSAPTVYAISHSHLDLEWLWTREETRRKTARTMGNQLQLLEEFPEHNYIQSQAWIFNTIKNEYPDLYEEVKKAVAEGKVVPEGGMWVESDINVPSGESLIRQFLVGKKFFAEEFGINSEIFWLPDSFGMTAALPQILKGCGIKYFVNCKVKWLYNDGDAISHTDFMWKGIDGSEVQTHICLGYEAPLTPYHHNYIWGENAQKEEIPYGFVCYGYGDGGGGSVRIHHELLEREKDLEGMPKVITATPNEFLEKVKNECEIKTTYVGELYFAAHRGTYTSQAKTKDLNRRNEFALREAEMWSALLGADTKVQTDELWKTVLFDQFHDIIPGSAITKVYEIVEKELGETLEKADEITLSVLDKVVNADSNSLTVVNSLSWERENIISLPDGYTSLEDINGNAVKTQMIDGRVYAMVDAPSCGFKGYKLGKDEVVCSTQKGNDLVLENDVIRAEFNNNGELVSVIDKNTGMEFLSDVSNKFRMYQDMPTFCDAWDIDSFYENVEVELGDDVVIEAGEKGELVSYLTIRKKIHNSQITQRVSVEAGSKQIKFETEVDWNESHKLLKVDFNTDIHTENMISEIQHGYCSRPNHKSRPYDEDRFEVCQHKWSALAEQNRGVAILNDNKYGISSDAGKMSLTLLKSAAYPARNADKGLQKFTYSFMPFTESLFDSEVVAAAYELNCPVVVKTGVAEEKSMISVDKKNIIIDAVKTAETENGDIIIRMYESKNGYTKCKLNLGFDVKKAYITNMIEENEREIEVNNNSITLDFKAFEVITLRLIK